MAGLLTPEGPDGAVRKRSFQDALSASSRTTSLESNDGEGDEHRTHSSDGPPTLVSPGQTEELHVDDLVSMLQHGTAPGLEYPAKFFTALSSALQSQRRLAHTLCLLYAGEVSRTVRPDLLFREDSMATKLLVSVLKGSASNRYLSKALRPVLRSLTMLPATADLSSDRELLATTLMGAVDALHRRITRIDQSLRAVFAQIELLVSRRWPERVSTLPGTLFFLRFVCPAISQPSRILKDQDIAPGAQKNCITVAKALQSIASSQAPAGPLTEEDAVKLRVAIDALWETLRTCVPTKLNDGGSNGLLPEKLCQYSPCTLSSRKAAILAPYLQASSTLESTECQWMRIHPVKWAPKHVGQFVKDKGGTAEVCAQLRSRGMSGLEFVMCPLGQFRNVGLHFSGQLQFIEQVRMGLLNDIPDHVQSCADLMGDIWNCNAARLRTWLDACCFNTDEFACLLSHSVTPRDILCMEDDELLPVYAASLSCEQWAEMVKALRDSLLLLLSRDRDCHQTEKVVSLSISGWLDKLHYTSEGFTETGNTSPHGDGRDPGQALEGPLRMSMGLGKSSERWVVLMDNTLKIYRSEQHANSDKSPMSEHNAEDYTIVSNPTALRFQLVHRKRSTLRFHCGDMEQFQRWIRNLNDISLIPNCKIEAELMPTPSVVSNERGKIVDVNRGAVELFGYNTAQEMLGQNVDVLMPEDVRKDHKSFMKRYLKTQSRALISSPRRVIAQGKDGTMFPIVIALGEFYNDKKRYFCANFRHESFLGENVIEEFLKDDTAARDPSYDWSCD